MGVDPQFETGDVTPVKHCTKFGGFGNGVGPRDPSWSFRHVGLTRLYVVGGLGNIVGCWLRPGDQVVGPVQIR